MDVVARCRTCGQRRDDHRPPRSDRACGTFSPQLTDGSQITSDHHDQAALIPVAFKRAADASYTVHAGPACVGRVMRGARGWDGYAPSDHCGRAVCSGQRSRDRATQWLIARWVADGKPGLRV